MRRQEHMGFIIGSFFHVQILSRYNLWWFWFSHFLLAAQFPLIQKTKKCSCICYTWSDFTVVFLFHMRLSIHFRLFLILCVLGYWWGHQDWIYPIIWSCVSKVFYSRNLWCWCFCCITVDWKPFLMNQLASNLIYFFLNSDVQCLLVKFASMCGATVAKFWNPNVTHVIAATDAEGACSRTLKVMKAILSGKWILKTSCELYFCLPLFILLKWLFMVLFYLIGCISISCALLQGLIEK